MQEKTGELLTQAQYEALSDEEKKLCHRIPEGTKDDTIEKLQKPIPQSVRRCALRKLNKVKARDRYVQVKQEKRRVKNKMAKQSRRVNRKK